MCHPYLYRSSYNYYRQYAEALPYIYVAVQIHKMLLLSSTIIIRVYGIYHFFFLHTKDYPSVGQIISLLTQFEVATIFAVAEDVLQTYQVI